MEPLIVRVEDTASSSTMDHAFLRSPIRIGRSARNDLCLPHSFVSAWHGVIEFDQQGARYTDLGSTNGTLLDGARLPASSAVPLGPHVTIAIGSLRLRVQARKGSDARPEPATAPEPPPEQAPVAPGGMTTVMRKLASVPQQDHERAWRRGVAPGAVIGRFELVRELGRGSFGVVFEAKDRQLGRRVALKVVRPGRGSQVLFGQELLQKEAEAAAQLNHPNIVSLHDAGTCESGPYLIMELLRGQTLRERMKVGRIPLGEALEIAIEIAWALDHAHAAGVVHRDLKPANVFLCDTGHVKVLDFGIAYLFGAGDTTAVGTPAYMAPEQWRHAPQDPRTDVFGAAAMLAEMVTGHLPYRVKEDWSAVLEPGARPSVAAPEAPASLLTLLRRALSPDPEQRPRDGQAWLAALLDVHERFQAAQPVDEPDARDAEGSPAGAPAGLEEEPGGEEPPRGPRVGAVVSVAVALVLAVSALAYLLVGWR